MSAVCSSSHTVMCVMKQQNARIIDSLLAAGVVVVAIVICAVLIMQPEDVMPSVVTVSARWE